MEVDLHGVTSPALRVWIMLRTLVSNWLPSWAYTFVFSVFCGSYFVRSFTGFQRFSHIVNHCIF